MNLYIKSYEGRKEKAEKVIERQSINITKKGKATSERPTKFKTKTEKIKIFPIKGEKILDSIHSKEMDLKQQAEYEDFQAYLRYKKTREATTTAAVATSVTNEVITNNDDVLARNNILSSDLALSSSDEEEGELRNVSTPPLLAKTATPPPKVHSSPVPSPPARSLITHLPKPIPPLLPTPKAQPPPYDTYKHDREKQREPHHGSNKIGSSQRFTPLPRENMRQRTLSTKAAAEAVRRQAFAINQTKARAASTSIARTMVLTREAKDAALSAGMAALGYVHGHNIKAAIAAFQTATRSLQDHERMEKSVRNEDRDTHEGRDTHERR